MAIKERMSGNEAVAYAIRQINPDVMPAFPITPSTEIPQMVSTYIANGEIAEIIRIGRHTEMYGFRFADVTMRLTDYDMEIDARLLLDSLYTDNQQSVNALNQRLLETVAEDYADVTNKRKFWEEMRKNGYYNALQVKFAYAITCHKAQGGQWEHVFVDQGYLTEENVDRGYLQWLYTAFTRATGKLYLVNFSDFFFNDTKR